MLCGGGFVGSVSAVTFDNNDTISPPASSSSSHVSHSVAATNAILAGIGHALHRLTPPIAAAAASTSIIGDDTSTRSKRVDCGIAGDPVLNGDIIHGIRHLHIPFHTNNSTTTTSTTTTAQTPRYALVYGGRSLVLMTRSSSTNTSISGWSVVVRWPRANDWIWHVHPLECCDYNTHEQTINTTAVEVAVGYSNNRVQIWRLTFASSSSAPSTTATSPSSVLLTMISEAWCNERTGLYSMTMSGTCQHTLTIMSGTVFSDILIWSFPSSGGMDHSTTSTHPTIITATPPKASLSSSLPSASPLSCVPDGMKVVPVQQRLSGHQGVIFNLQCNNPLATSRICVHRHNIVASSLSSSITPQSLPSICSVSDDRSVRIWIPSSTEGRYECRLIGYGHTARVWRCLFLPLPTTTTKTTTAGTVNVELVATVGEDGTCRIWRTDKPTSIACFNGHHGGIWSLAYDIHHHVIATGGVDATIRLWSLQSLLTPLLPSIAPVSSSSKISSMEAKSNNNISTRVIPSLSLLSPVVADTKEKKSKSKPDLPKYLRESLSYHHDLYPANTLMY
jgi:hypothetical protein